MSPAVVFCLMHSVKLKYIDLSFSENLIRTPDFSGVPRLEGLNLSCCDSLVEIHPSIGQLSRLQYLKLDSCESLTDLPSMSAEMQSLTLLDLSCCYSFHIYVVGDDDGVDNDDGDDDDDDDDGDDDDEL
ncbi:tmv resistance protein n [Quercus suber]|uniref:Tmv resistance protein n n=1 Tax=Quercus suber TaxID=58331 RepID=A0AAW0KH67_QUESU